MNSKLISMHTCLLLACVLLSIWGNGCCTVGVIDVCRSQFGTEHDIKKREVVSVETENKLVINIEECITKKYFPLEWLPLKSVSRRQMVFPLDKVPKNAKSYHFKLKPVTEPRYRVVKSAFENIQTVDGHYTKKSTSPLMMACFDLPEGESLTTDSHKIIKLHPDDYPLFFTPFRVTYTKSNKLKRFFYEKMLLDYDSMRFNYQELMIPYKIAGNDLYAYSASSLLPNWRLLSLKPEKYRDANVSTYLFSCVLVPPAFVIDVALLPIHLIAIGAFLIVFRY